MQPPARVFLTRREAADWLSAAGLPIKPATLQRMVSDGGGPPFEKRGRLALYRITDLEVYLDRAIAGTGTRPAA